VQAASNKSSLMSAFTGAVKIDKQPTMSSEADVALTNLATSVIIRIMRTPLVKGQREKHPD
jgi:hypothetical protein